MNFKKNNQGFTPLDKKNLTGFTPLDKEKKIRFWFLCKKNLTGFTPLDKEKKIRFWFLCKKNLTGFTPLDKEKKIRFWFLCKKNLTGFTPLDKKNLMGFTLIEITVAIAIFGVIMLSATQIFRSVIEGQRSAIAAQNTQESMRYAMEVMSKSIRQAQKGEDFCELSAGTAVNSIYNIDNTTGNVGGINRGSDVLYFQDKYGTCHYYFLNASNTLYMASSTPLVSIEVYAMTPDEIKVSDLGFSIFDDYPIGTTDPLKKHQPRVTLKMKVRMQGGKEIHKNEFVIQTTLSDRHY